MSFQSYHFARFNNYFRNQKTNGNSQIIAGQFANIRYSQNTCSDMQMNLVQIDNQGRFNQL